VRVIEPWEAGEQWTREEDERSLHSPANHRAYLRRSSVDEAVRIHWIYGEAGLLPSVLQWLPL